MLTVGCAKENITSDAPSGGKLVKVTFSATQEGTQTRTSVGADGRAVNWSESDAISVFDGKSNTKYTLTSGAGETSATFDSDAGIHKADKYIALYPYQSGVTMSDGVLYGVTLKNEQTAVAGSFDPEAALMLAQTESGSLSLKFKNVVGYVKVTPLFDCKKITFVRNGESGILAGKLSLKMNGDTPSIASKVAESSAVSISGDIKAGSSYYIAVLPVTLSSGFRLVFTDAAGKEKYRESGNDPDIDKSKVVNLGEISASDLQEDDTTPYVTFSADAEQTFKMKSLYSSFAAEMIFEYSVGNGNWIRLDEKSAVPFGGELGNLRLRGKSSTGTGENGRISFGDASVPVRCTGDIRTLVDYENYSTVNTADAIFIALFADSKELVSAPALPSTALASKCYYAMFRNCSGLTSTPEFPATELAEKCYYEMFKGCTNLKSVSVLPATTLKESCYSGMFRGCTGLTSVPEDLLPAENLATSCYSSMFNGSGLTTGPKLPAEAMEASCYATMFLNCQSLTSVPELPATSLATNCYEGMFYNCAGLTSVPESLLPAEVLAENCYKSMFSYCGNLTSTPALPAKTLENACYEEMFIRCSSLEKAPKVLPAETLKQSCYMDMFHGCTKLEIAPQIDASTLAPYCCKGMFEETALTESPILKAETLVNNCYASMFAGCSKLVKVTIKAKSRGDASDPLYGWLSRYDSPGTIIGAVHKRAEFEFNDGEVPYYWTVENTVTD